AIDAIDHLRESKTGQLCSRQSEVASVISKLASRHRSTGRVFDRPRSGAQSVTDHNHDQNLRPSDLRHLQARLPDVRGTRWTQDHVTWTMQQCKMPRGISGRVNSLCTNIGSQSSLSIMVSVRLSFCASSTACVNGRWNPAAINPSVGDCRL
uniref:Uncharacterized protein n=1 Tax=Oryzias latipes TaxID=8090 RepID=A0A3B3IC49_ORYLA